MERISIYTAIIGDKDKERHDIKCFTGYGQFNRPVMNAKIFKILSHQYLDTDISIWVDGNIQLLIEPERLVKEWLGDADMAVWKHFERDCIYEEAPAAIGLGGNYVDMIEEQVDHYRKKGFPPHAGLAECNVIIRRHNNKVREFNNAWWAEICRWSCRDQIAFPYVLKDFDLKVNYIKGNVREHEWFAYTPHTHTS